MDNFLIVGLGNIGAEYANTRHNMGFMVLDAWAQASNIVFSQSRYGSMAETTFKGRRFHLLKPSTYMNLSGKAVRYWMNELKLPIADTDSDNGFPEDDPQGERTVSGVTLDDMYTTYTVRYTEAINSGEARTVAATSDGGRTDIRMYRLPYADDTVEENGVRYQICQFAAIVPVQQIRTQETLLTMNIRTIVGIGEDGSQVVLEKAYTYTPSRLIDMQQGKITVLRLDASTDDSEPVLLSAEVQPWNPSWTETELLPE